ncbi:MAG: cyclase family protein [Solirubrobacteraceae bacterium]
MSSVDAQPAGAVATVLAGLHGLTVYDVSPTIDAELPMWFMHEQPLVSPIVRHDQGGAAVNTLSLNEHTGTHVDAPFHFDANGQTMAQVPVDALLLRPYCKYDLTGDDHQPGDLIGLEHLKAAQERAGFTLRPGDVAIIEVGWDRNLPGGPTGRDRSWWGRNQPGLSEEACEYLATAGVRAVASDTAACDIGVVDAEVTSAHGHASAFLPRGILIVEGLTGLAAVPATGLFLAVPLKIADGTGSPVRIVLLAE